MPVGRRAWMLRSCATACSMTLRSSPACSRQTVVVGDQRRREIWREIWRRISRQAEAVAQSPIRGIGPRHTEAHRGTPRHTEAYRGTPRHTEAYRGTPRHTEAYSSGGGGASTRRRRPVGQCACTACAVGNPVGRMGAPRPLGLLCTYCRGRAAARCHRAAAGCRRAGAGPGPGQAGPGRAGPEMCTSRRAAICRTSACAEERCDVCSSSDWGGVRGEGWGV
jgi:hypothetical protein